MCEEHPDKTLCVYHDLENVKTPLQLVQCVFDDVEEYLGGLKKWALKTRTFLSELRGAEFKGFRLPEVAAPHWKNLLETIVKDLLDHQQDRFIFFWDEFPIMIYDISKENPEAAMELLDTLRSLRQMNSDLRMVYTGSIGIHNVIASLKKHGYANEPINDMARKILPPLSLQDATDLALRLLEGEKIDCNDSKTLARKIAVSVDCLPYYIQHVVDRMVAAGRKTDESTVEKLVLQGLTDPGDAWDMRYFRNRIDMYYQGEERDMALAILDVLSTAGDPLPFGSLFDRVKSQQVTNDKELTRKVLELLASDHYIVQGDDGAYRFNYPLIQRWWTINRGLGEEAALPVILNEASLRA